MLTFGILFSVLAGGYLLFFTGNTPIKNYPSSGSDIVAFGDSLVFGVGATPGSDFVSVLGREIGVPIVNLGKSGDTTLDGLARLEEVTGYDAKIVLLLFGGNDYIRKIPTEETFVNLGTMIQEIQSTGAIVVLLGVRGGVLVDGYDDDFEALAEKYQTAYVSNVLDGLFDRPKYMSDTIHPNDAGYARIADRVFEQIKDLLE